LPLDGTATPLYAFFMASYFSLAFAASVNAGSTLHFQTNNLSTKFIAQTLRSRP
jgi:hypothetical protein